MVEKKIMIDGREVPFRASAAIPRLYRFKFRRDIFKDLFRLGKQIDRAEKEKNEDDEDGDDIPIDDLELFENVAYIMAKHADPKQPDTPEEWLDQFDTFSIYEVLPQLLDLWHINVRTDVQAKKNRNRLSGK